MPGTAGGFSLTGSQASASLPLPGNGTPRNVPLTSTLVELGLPSAAWV